MQSYNKGRTRSNKSLFFCYCCPLRVFSDREIDGYRTPVPGVSAGKTKTGAPLRCASRKTKTEKNPLRWMQNVSCEPWTLYPSENPSSKLGYFQTATASPYRVLHPAQGDKQKKQTLSSTTRNTSSVTRSLVLHAQISPPTSCPQERQAGWVKINRIILRLAGPGARCGGRSSACHRLPKRNIGSTRTAYCPHRA